MVILSFMQSELGSNAPLSNKDELIHLPYIELRKTHFDTIPEIDTLITNGTTKYDTTYQYKSRGTSTSSSTFNKNIIVDYLSDIPFTKQVTVYSDNNLFDFFINGVKLTMQLMFADENYFKIFDHKIIAGRAFESSDITNANQVMVISSLSAEKYFGRTENILGEEIKIDEKTYEIIGVYQHSGKIISFVSPDAILPHTILDESDSDPFYFGGFRAIYQKDANIEINQLKKEIVNASANIPLDHPANDFGFNEVKLVPRTYNEMFAQGIYYDRDPTKSHRIIKWTVLLLLLFFIALPTINLINLNTSRILERSSEIGVRKSFGATDTNIVTQFIAENIIQTFIGGIIGLCLAILMISFLNNIGYMANAKLIINFKFFLYSFIVTLFFGIVSGAIPAYRMSKLPIVNALKENKL